MGCNKNHYVNTKASALSSGLLNRQLHSGKEKKHDAYLSSYQRGSATNKVIAAYYGGAGGPWAASVTGAQTALKASYWNIIQDAGGGAPTMINGATGLVLTSETSDNGNTTIQTARQITPATGQTYHASTRLTTNNLDLTIAFGFCNADDDPIANLGSLTDYVLWYEDADPGDGVLAPGVRGDTGTASAGTDLTARTASRDIYLGMTFSLATSASQGSFWYSLGAAAGMDGNSAITEVPFSANQITQLNKWLDTAPTSIIGVLEVKNSSANSRTCTIQHIAFEVDRTS